MIKTLVDDLVGSAETAQSSEPVLNIVPAVICSNPQFAIFFYLDNKELESGIYCQGIPGRINLRPSQKFSLPCGREVLLPDMSLDSRGTVSISSNQHDIYCGTREIDMFFAKFPDFDIYRQYVQNFIYLAETNTP